MANDNRSKSILLQVAFKAAVETGAKEVAEATRTFYSTLLMLHDEFGITLEDYTPKAKSAGGFPKKESKPLAEGAGTFILDGVEWVDYRAAKQGGTVSAKHPDFKTRDQSKGSGQSVWMIDQEGNPNAEVEALVAAANVVAIF